MNFFLKIFSKQAVAAVKKEEKEIPKDCYGNPFSISREGEQFVRVTQTNRMSDFEFLGNCYSYRILKQNKTLKTYVDDSNCQRLLQKDIYGRLLLYFYDEYMRMDDDDREDHLWVVVKSKAEADKFENTYRLSRLRVPYISADEGSWMVAHQYVGMDNTN